MPRWTASQAVADGERGVGDDFGGEGFGAGQELGGGHDLIDQADAEGFGGVDHVSGEEDFEGAAFADEARQALGASVAGDESEFDFRLAEAGGVGGEADGAGEGELAAGSEGEAVDGGDDRLAAGFDEREDGLAAGGESGGRGGVQRGEFGDVGTGDEGLVAFSGEDGDAHVVVLLARRGRPGRDPAWWRR